MVKRQRGKVASKAKQSEAVKRAALLPLPCLSSSDDEAPDEVTFEDSKVAALRSMQLALDSARREKEQLKEKRRKRQERFQEQKKKKLLSDEVLQEIDSVPSEVQKQPEEEVSQTEDEQQTKKQLLRKRKLDSKYTVTVLSKDSLASVQQKVAEDFIQSQLYGPGSRRTTNNELLSLQNKSGRIKNAAVQFVKVNWASKEKAKAAKIKKKWIQKQKLQS